MTRSTVAVTSEAAAPLVSRPSPILMARSNTAWSRVDSVGTDRSCHTRNQAEHLGVRRADHTPFAPLPTASAGGASGSEVRRRGQHREGRSRAAAAPPHRGLGSAPRALRRHAPAAPHAAGASAPSRMARSSPPSDAEETTATTRIAPSAHSATVSTACRWKAAARVVGERRSITGPSYGPPRTVRAEGATPLPWLWSAAPSTAERPGGLLHMTIPGAKDRRCDPHGARSARRSRCPRRCLLRRPDPASAGELPHHRCAAEPLPAADRSARPGEAGHGPGESRSRSAR